MAGGQPATDLGFVHQVLRPVSFCNIPFILSSEKIGNQKLDRAKPMPRQWLQGVLESIAAPIIESDYGLK